MSDDEIIRSLKAKRADILGEVMDLEGRLNQARQHLAHVDGTLRLYGQELYPKVRGPRSGLKFQRGELQRFILRQLHGRALTTRALAEAMTGDKGWDTSDDKLLQLLIHRVGGSLHRLRSRGFVESAIEGTVGVWRLAEQEPVRGPPRDF